MATQMNPEIWCHETRKQIDAVIQNVKLVKPSFDNRDVKGGRELAFTYTHLQEAKMWLGKVLEELGSELPKEFPQDFKQTPEEWMKTEEYKWGVIIDPDGWDRKNLDEDLKIPLTHDEFARKFMMSTIRRIKHEG